MCHLPDDPSVGECAPTRISLRAEHRARVADGEVSLSPKGVELHYTGARNAVNEEQLGRALRAPENGPRRHVMDTVAQPPATLEGWYASHQAFALDRQALRARPAPRLRTERCVAGEVLAAALDPPGGGWSAVVPLVGSMADVLFIHLRPTLDELGAAERAVARLELLDNFRLAYAFLSVTEVGLYHLPDLPAVELPERMAAERESEHNRRRLYPPRSADMPYVSFYPTSKRRDVGQNWYTLPLRERCELMRRHGLIGRQHAGQVRQIITGAIGLDRWEWGVTLFAADPLALKRVVTDMRYDEVSARYAEFGEFYVGRVAEPRAWAMTVGT
jgi:hydrogen peroxide-dependent heme synthase